MVVPNRSLAFPGIGRLQCGLFPKGNASLTRNFLSDGQKRGFPRIDARL